MTVRAKICGLNTAEAMEAAVGGGAAYVGLVFYPPSPRAVSPPEAARLAALVPERTARVGVFVDADDDAIAAVLDAVDLDFLQLHGREPPDRVAGIRRRFARPVIKAIKLAGRADLAAAARYSDAADRLLFDAKPPKTMAHALPGGNAVAFDWRLLAGTSWPVPWMLSGGLDAANVAEAVTATGASEVDVSSGVEDEPGRKSTAKIAAFLAAVGRL